MRRWVLSTVVAVLVAGVTPSAAGAEEPAAPAAPAACSPSVSFLGELGGGLDPALGGGGGVLGINDAGIAVGYVFEWTGGSDTGRTRFLPAYWKGTTLKRVPIPPTFDSGEVRAVNHFGLMVGEFTESHSSRRAGFRYWAGNASATVLSKAQEAVDVNNSGHAVGSDGSQNAYEYSPGPLVRRQLGSLVDHGYTFAVGPGAINDSGTIIGAGGGRALSGPTSDAELALQPIWWTPTDNQPRLLPAPSDPSDTPDLHRFSTRAMAIDNANRVVGSIEDQRGVAVGNYYTAAYWASLTAMPQKVLPDPSYRPAGVSTIDKTIGVLNSLSYRSRLAAGWVDYVYHDGDVNDATGKAVVWPLTGPLRVLKDPPGTWLNTEANAVSDDGRVAGRAVDTHNWPHPVVWNCALQQVQ